MTTDAANNGPKIPPPAGNVSVDPARRRNRLVAASIGLLALVGGVVFALTRLNGQDTSALVAVPDDVHIVFSMDLYQVVRSDGINSLVSAFAEPMAAAGYVDEAEIDLAESIASELEEELGVDLEEDILSWMGRSLAFGVWFPAGALDPIPTEFVAGPDPDVVAVVSVTDPARAAAFLEGLDEFVSSAPFEDGESYRFAEMDGGVVWLGDDLMVLATSEEILSKSLEARGGTSIVESKTFDDVASRLPADRLMTGYLSTDFFGLLAEAAALGEAQAGFPGIDDVLGLGFSVSLIDAGLRFDAVQVLSEAASSPPASGEIRAVAALPAETVGFFAGVIPEGAIAEAVASFRDLDPEAYDEMLGQMSLDLGVDIEADLLPSIGGEALLAVVPDTAGAIAVEGGVDIGILISLGLIEAGPMGDLLSALELLLSEEMGLAVVQGTPIQLMGEDQVLAAYELREDSLVLGSSAEVVNGFVAGDGGVTETEVYRQLDAELPGAGLAFYVNVPRVLDLIDMSPEDRAIAEPVKGIGASSSQEGTVLTSSIIILIDYLP
ncbi:MAG: DUF3352 domain-containing protein [Acidimicrobiia bacterium]|nr:DUF3352 domain-containing protein [Acidimicrobiia bacterium]